jgi:toxin ParE1/3/4
VARNYQVIVSPRASGDLSQIYEYIALDSPENAAKFLQALFDAIDSLVLLPARHPLIESRPRIKRETRVMPVSPYLIYYHILEAQGAVRIVTVRHGARRQPRRFS